MKFGTFFEPMLLKEKSKPFDDEECIFELKFDGIRSTMHVSKDVFRIYTRRGVDVTSQFPELESIRGLVEKKVIFDGEIVAFEEGSPNFSKLSRRNRLKDKKKIDEEAKRNPVYFVAFDILYEDEPLVDLPLIKRKKILDKYPSRDSFMKTEYIEKEGMNLFSKVKEAGLEGIVAKKKDSIYEIGTRSFNWIKVKNFKKGVFFVGGWVDNKIKCSLLLGEYQNKKFNFVGKVSIPRTSKLYRKLRETKAKDKTPFGDYDERNMRYLSPKIRVEVSYMERTPGGNLRQPVFKREVT